VSTCDQGMRRSECRAKKGHAQDTHTGQEAHLRRKSPATTVSHHCLCASPSPYASCRV
jgi:hypothetical protein